MDKKRTDALTVYRIMAVASFGGRSGGLRSGVGAACGTGGIEEAMTAVAPSVDVLLPREYCPSGRIVLQPENLDDFLPERIVKKIPYLEALCNALGLVRRAGRDGTDADQMREKVTALLPGLELDFSVLEESAPASKTPPSTAAGSAIDDLFSLVDVQGSDDRPGDVSRHDAFRGLRVQLEATLRQVMQRLLRSPEFRKIESSWRGAALMLHGSAVQEQPHKVVFTLVTSEDDALSGLLQELRELPAEKLPNMLLLDTMLQNTPSGLDLLEQVLETADMLMIPVALYAGPDFFGLDEWKEISRLSYLPNYLEDAYFARWRRLRDHPGGTWTAVLLNRLPARKLFDGDDGAVCGTAFHEKEQPWITPVWALGALTAKCVRSTAWPLHLDRMQRFFLESMTLRDDEAVPVEMLFSEERIEQFTRAGFTPLASPLRSDTVFLPGMVSIKGKSLEFNLFFSMLLGFLFRLKECIEAGECKGGAGDIADALKDFLVRGGDEPPDDLEVSFGSRDDRGAPVLSVGFTPPGSLLAADKVDFTLGW